MNNRKQTKRALLTSVMALVMCVVMLVGTTFAWFTDTATANVNKIRAGNLDIQLLYANNATGENAEWNEVTANTELKFLQSNGTTATQQNFYWEPGGTYSLPALKIVNNGNLNLKYKILINGIKGDAELNKVIDWTMKLDGTDFAIGSEHILTAAAGAESVDILTISGHMQETAGNTYMNKEIDGITITLKATQATGEYDSTRDDYDKNAAYPIVNTNDILAAIKQGGSVLAGANFRTPDGLDIAATADISLSGNTWIVGNNTELLNGASLSVSDGTVLRETFAGYVDVRPGSTSNSVVTYTDVVFKSTYSQSRTTFGTCTNHTDSVVEFTPEAEGHATLIFKNCTFDNSMVLFEGLSDGAGTFTAVFDNCKFTALTNSELISVENYLAGSTITVKDCTFDVTATGNLAIIGGMGKNRTTVTFEGKNAFTGRIATPTGADKEGTAEEIRIFSEDLTVKACEMKNIVGADNIHVSGIVQK